MYVQLILTFFFLTLLFSDQYTYGKFISVCGEFRESNMLGFIFFECLMFMVGITIIKIETLHHEKYDLVHSNLSKVFNSMAYIFLNWTAISFCFIGLFPVNLSPSLHLSAVTAAFCLVPIDILIICINDSIYLREINYINIILSSVLIGILLLYVQAPKELLHWLQKLYVFVLLIIATYNMKGGEKGKWVI